MDAKAQTVALDGLYATQETATLLEVVATLGIGLRDAQTWAWATGLVAGPRQSCRLTRLQAEELAADPRAVRALYLEVVRLRAANRCLQMRLDRSAETARGRLAQQNACREAIAAMKKGRKK